MTLDQLRIFAAVAERQHVTRAAEALHLSQSAVSGAIHALEARHQVTLFDRVGRRVELTAEGRIFLVEAQDILARVRLAEATLEDLGRLGRGSLAIHSSQTIASSWLPSRIGRFNARHPGVSLSVSVGNTADCARAVERGEADLGFVEGAIREGALRIEVVARDRLVVVVGRSHPWADAVPDLPAALAETGWALREGGSGTRSTFEAALADFDVALADLDVALELPSNEALAAVIETGRLAGALSEAVVRQGVADGRLVALPLRLPERDFSLVRHRERHVSRAAAAFAALLAEPADAARR